MTPSAMTTPRWRRENWTMRLSTNQSSILICDLSSSESKACAAGDDDLVAGRNVVRHEPAAGRRMIQNDFAPLEIGVAGLNVNPTRPSDWTTAASGTITPLIGSPGNCRKLLTASPGASAAGAFVTTKINPSPCTCGSVAAARPRKSAATGCALPGTVNWLRPVFPRPILPPANRAAPERFPAGRATGKNPAASSSTGLLDAATSCASAVCPARPGRVSFGPRRFPARGAEALSCALNFFSRSYSGCDACNAARAATASPWRETSAAESSTRP